VRLQGQRGGGALSRAPGYRGLRWRPRVQRMTDVDFAAPGADGFAAAAAEGLSGMCFLAGLGLDEMIGQDLGADERAALERLRSETLPAALAQVGPVSFGAVDEFTLLRFLRADNFRPELAAARLVKMLQWRADNRVDHILAESPACLPVYKRLRVRLFPGWDRNGNIVMLERIGEFFGSDSGNQLSREEWLRCSTHDMATIHARFRDSSREHGRPVHRLTFLGDLGGLRFDQALENLKILKACVKEIEAHFPEQAGQIFLYNAPLLMETIWCFVKRILDPSVAAKVAIHRGVPTEEFLKLIPAEVLPQELGGENPVKYPHAVTCHEQLAMVRKASMPSSVAAPGPLEEDSFCFEADRPGGVCSWPWASCLEREQDTDGERRRPLPAGADGPQKERSAPTCADRTGPQGPRGKQWPVHEKMASSRCVVAGGGCRHLFAAFSLAALPLAVAVAAQAVTGGAAVGLVGL